MGNDKFNFGDIREIRAKDISILKNLKIWDYLLKSQASNMPAPAPIKPAPAT